MMYRTKRYRTPLIRYDISNIPTKTPHVQNAKFDLWPWPEMTVRERFYSFILKGLPMSNSHAKIIKFYGLGFELSALEVCDFYILVNFEKSQQEKYYS